MRKEGLFRVIRGGEKWVFHRVERSKGAGYNRVKGLCYKVRAKAREFCTSLFFLHSENWISLWTCISVKPRKNHCLVCNC